MFEFVETGKVALPIYQPEAAPAGTSNKEYLANYVRNLLHNAFSNLQP